MSMWCVKPESITIDLKFVTASGTFPFWIKVKKFLTIGEERRVQTAGWRGVSRTNDDSNGSINIDWRVQSFARAELYLVDWSLEDEDTHQRLDLVSDVIQSLHPDVYALIEQAINVHVVAMAEEKKLPSGSSAPSVTSA